MTEDISQSVPPAAASADSDSAPATDGFAAVPAVLRPALLRRGFTELTTVQVAALAAAEAGRDLRISSQTGSGKTVALGFAMAPQLVASEMGKRRLGPTAVVIVPTRELAAQVSSELEWLFADVRGFAIDCVTGGTPLGAERRRLMRPPAVLVGTPGRLLDHIRSGAVDCSTVGQLVLDEADQMLDLGFREDLEAILATMPAERATHLVSATLPVGVLELADRFQRDAQHVEGTRLGAANADIEHVGHLLHVRERYATLVNLLLLAGEERTLVFVRTRSDSTDLAEQLAKDGFAAAPISGELAQAQRTRTLAAFREGVTTVLVATDVAARGLDIAEVNTIVHFDPPIDSEVYTHRSGRTGRAGRKGVSVLFAPAFAQRKMERLTGQARVKIEWRRAPNAETVRSELAARARTHVQEALASAAAPSEDRVTFARQLLDAADPAQVVATLLGMLDDKNTATKPREVASAAPRAAPTWPTWSPERPQLQRQRGDSSFTRFSINWGTRSGASPQRILAHVCRRGDIRSGAIGGIQIGATSTTFDVATECAVDFAARVSRPDSRDPGVTIELVDSDGPIAPARKPLPPARSNRAPGRFERGRSPRFAR